MPSLPSFLRSSRNSQQIDRSSSSITAEQDGSGEKVQRSKTKRDFFRKFLKRSSIGSDSPGNQLQKEKIVSTSVTQQQSAQSAEQPSSPMSNPNKPLPPPPANTIEEPLSSKAPVKLNRIISPIATADLHKLFSGAPQFFARSEGHGAGAPHPSVAYPFNGELDVRDLSDHFQIQDEAWGSVTAWPHITLQVSKNPVAVKEQHEKQKAHFLPRCRERPSMLSMQGIERGTMGFQAALEMGVADALEYSQESSHTNSKSISERRKKFLNGKDGLRPLSDTALVERLMAVSEIYHGDPKKSGRPTIELYTELFTQTLYPPSRVTDSQDPYSLQVQVEALIQVLTAKYVWLDFSLVEWRIRLGQILWASPSDPDPEDEVTINDEAFQELNTQKYWLLLQILLASELLLRLDAVSINLDSGKDAGKPEEIHRFEKSATTSVKWSLILARHWLENIRIEKTVTNAVAEKKAPTGWLSSLTNAPEAEVTANETLDNVRFEGRHQTRQLLGLVHFARKLNWPNVDTIVAKISANGITISESTFNTPAGTPRSVTTQRSSSYFSRRPGMRRGLSVNNRMSAIIHPSGWLSNSYISGFILPGESLSHLLISTLLENDELAVSKLGEEANLYGGFVYQKKSFWSTRCVVGRILAAGKGSSECMGWISSNIVPKGASEGWVDIDVEDVDTLSDKENRPRIYRKTTIERRGHIIGGADASSVLPGDFIFPSDESSQAALSVSLESVDLFAAVDSIPSTPTKDTPTPFSGTSEASKIKTYSAMVRFTVAADGEPMKEVNLSLTKDVFFLTAHPCIPSQNIEMLKSPTTPSFHPSEGNHISGTSSHPLHKAFTYTKIPLNQLLSTPSSSAFSSLLSPSPSPNSTHSSTHTTSSSIRKVLVIDCTDSTMNMFPPRPSSLDGLETPTRREHKAKFGSDLEMLGRAFCSERGWNALVSRRGRGCLACAIREAGSVGWRVVLRVA